MRVDSGDMNLIQLSETPRHHPDCCVSLSTTLITQLCAILPAHPQYSISIGSGSGMLEALINQSNPQMHVHGVEVDQSMHKYLSEEMTLTVIGTHALCSAAARAAAWLFVYPREVALVERYVHELGDSVEKIVWLGPQMDWPDYEPIFKKRKDFDFSVQSSADCGLAPYETLVVIEKI